LTTHLSTISLPRLGTQIIPRSGFDHLPQLDPDADPADPEVEELLRQHQQAPRAQVKKDAGFDEAINVSWSNFEAFPVKKLKQHNFPWTNQGAMQLLDSAAAGNQPFFLYAATTAIHGPAHQEMFQHDLRYTPGGKNDGVMDYMPPVEDIQRRIAAEPEWMAHKIAGMACLDHHVGLVLDKLEELGVADNTIVMFMADHNVEPGKATVYDKGNIVPMIVRWPGRITGGAVSDSLVQSLDVAPTILDAAGAPPAADELDGESLAPVFTDAAAKTRDHVYLESGYTRAITDGRHKYVAFRLPEKAATAMKAGKTEFAPNHLGTQKQAHSQIAIEHHSCYFDVDQLYDLEADPYEQKNVPGESGKAAEIEALESALKEKLATFQHPFDLTVDPFFASEQYQKLAANARAIGTDHISWLRRDHGKIVWPPEQP
jgi:arylsulfatase A-like enzyme